MQIAKYMQDAHNGLSNLLVTENDAMLQPAPENAKKTQKRAPYPDDRRPRALARPAKAKKAAEVMPPGETFECFIPGDPVPWARPIPTRNGGVTPEKQRRHCQILQLHLRKAWGQKPAIPLGVPVAVEIAFVFASDKKPPGSYKGVKPDVDNLGKIVLDALQGSHVSLVLSNDSQVALQIVSKVYGTVSGTLIRVRVLE